MPLTPVVFYQDLDHSSPVREWLLGLPAKARARCAARLELLEEFGHELRRPHAENLGNGLWELRIKVGRVNYRILYFFHRQVAAVVCHGLAKEDVVPERDLRIAADRMARFQANPRQHGLRLRE